MAKCDTDMELGEHIDELRRRVILALVSVLIFSIVAFILKEDLINIIFAPAQSDFIFNRWALEISERFSMPQLAINQQPFEVINTKMAGQFNLHIKASAFAGFVCSMPVLLWQLWAFVRPAVDTSQQGRCNWLILQVLALFFVGLSFGYFLISPLAVNFLANYSFSSNIENYIEVTSYLSTVINISLASALIFQLPHLVFILARIGVLKAEMMRRYRRLAIVIIVIVSAIITPPDVFSQLLIALPFYLLYECGIGVAAKEEIRQQKRSEMFY